MEREPVKSTTVGSVGYEGESKTLEIEFQSGAVYQYFDVPETVHKGLLSAESKGQCFNNEIRDEYTFERLGRGRRAAKG